MIKAKIHIAEWHTDNPRWSELEQFFDTHKEGLQEVIHGYDQRESRVLVASTHHKVVGILRFIVIPIGPENDLPAVKIDDKELLQAKVMNFFVLPDFRCSGIGRRLQAEAIALAKSLSCYQLASFSFAKHEANHRLKLSMGYAVQPEFRQNGKAHGLYFIMPLHIDNNAID
ncbi:MAG: GNAT family N-acetyltransferase [Chloroflexota bacterium]